MRKAVVVGFDYHAAFLRDLINEESDTWRLRFFPATRFGTLRAVTAALKADAIVSFGGPGPNMALAEIARWRNIPVIVIWSGSDIPAARRDPQLLELIKRYRFTNVAAAPWLVDELRELGIDARYVPVTAADPSPLIAALPRRFSVLSYLPEPRRAFHGEKLIYSIAREFPDVPFRVVGRGSANPVAPANVEFLGHTGDVPRVIDDSTVLLRLPEHDGKSKIVIEALARGRHVIWNHELPGVRRAQHAGEASRILRELLAEAAAGALEPNAAGYEFVSSELVRSKVAAGFENVMNTATASHTARKQAERRVAISGLDLFCAQVCEELERGQYGWSPEMLRARVRLEVATSIVKLLSCDVWYTIGSPIGDRWLHLVARILRKPKVIHWVGSDIMALYTNKRLRRFCQSPNVVNVAEVDWTIDELRRLGIDATLAPLSPRQLSRRALPLPERFTILLYLPRTRGEFYGRREYERLIRTFAKRNVRFIVVGGGDFYAPPEADVLRMGWCASLEDVYRESTVLIRFTKHDGLSLMALEALTHGRYVLWSQDFPFAQTVRSYDDIERNIADLLERFERGELETQTEAARYVAETYSPARCVARLADAWNRASRKDTHANLLAESS